MKRLFVLQMGALLLTSALGTANAQSPPKVVRSPQVVPPDEMKWGTYKQATPAGSKVAILYGNPENVGGGPFVMRVRAADGSSVGPQWHSVDLHITVLQGTLAFGEGNVYDESKAQRLNPGSYIQVPRGSPYTLVARGETEYQVQGNAVLRTYAVAPPAPVTAAQPPAVSTEEQKQKTEFDAAVAAFTRASRASDQSALQGSVRREFERIARGGGRYATSAQEYLTTRFGQTPALVQSGACPVIPALKDRGWIVQEPKAGDVVATGLLDNRLVWTNCPTPRFPDLARTTTPRPTTLKLAVTLDEAGRVVTVKLRGGIAPPGYYEAAEAAVRQWKTNPPRAKGVAVRTEVSVDIPFTP